MVVDDLDLPRCPVVPGEANAPLVVDADGVLPSPFASQGLQAVARRNTQVIELAGCIDHQELRSRPLLNRHWQATDNLSRKDRRSLLVCKTVDQGSSVSAFDTQFKKSLLQNRRADMVSALI